MQLQKRCFANLLKSRFGMAVFLQFCRIFSEQLLLKKPLEGCFWTVKLLFINHIYNFLNCLQKVPMFGGGKITGQVLDFNRGLTYLDFEAFLSSHNFAALQKQKQPPEVFCKKGH